LIHRTDKDVITGRRTAAAAWYFLDCGMLRHLKIYISCDIGL